MKHLSTIIVTIAATVAVVTLSACLPGGGGSSTHAKGDSTVVTPKGPVAVIETSFGTIVAELYKDDAPKTVANFVGLAREKYYDSVSFHRIARGFVIQGGDPTGTGSGGKTFDGKVLVDELNQSAPSFQAGYRKGVLAMANKGRPGTGTSQFFIMLDDVRSLPREYTIFGKVISGLEVVDSIGSVDIIPMMGPGDGRPKTPIIMKSVTIQDDSVTTAH
jgi:cyclophilin family peptidyl-prolyl cis-trans isomerase